MFIPKRKYTEFSKFTRNQFTLNGIKLWFMFNMSIKIKKTTHVHLILTLCICYNLGVLTFEMGFGREEGAFMSFYVS